MNYEYPLNRNRLRIEQEELLLKLAEAGCPVQALHQQDESLESYYLDLIGGNKHA